MSPDFSDESVPRTLEDQADREVRIVFLLLEAGVDESSLERDVADLLLRQLFIHDLLARNLTHDKLLLAEQVFLKLLVFFHDTFEGERYLLAAFHDLLPEHLVFDPGVFESEEDGVLLVDPLNLLALDIVEHARAIDIIIRDSLVLELVVLDVHDLFQMKYVVHSLQHVSHKLLLKLDLD